MTSHYFSSDPGGEARPRRVEFTAYGRTYALDSSTGVFSGDRLDIGTSVLFRSAPLPSTGGTLLDLGCGYGPIATVLASTVPAARVWAVDVNPRAVELCRANTTVYGNVSVGLPEEVPADVRFDEIWSNPPIRIGKPALHALLATWLDRLTDDGQAWLVVARNLGADSLQGWLQGEGWRVERRGSAKGFRVLRVAR